MLLKRSGFALACLLAGCGEPEGELLYVAPYTMACIGAGPMNCMRVHGEGESNYQLFYNHIEGFEFEPGYNYVLRVAVTERESPPADAGSQEYRLLKIVSKESVE